MNEHNISMVEMKNIYIDNKGPQKFSSLYNSP